MGASAASKISATFQTQSNPGREKGLPKKERQTKPPRNQTQPCSGHSETSSGEKPRASLVLVIKPRDPEQRTSRLTRPLPERQSLWKVYLGTQGRGRTPGPSAKAHYCSQRLAEPSSSCRGERDDLVISPGTEPGIILLVLASIFFLPASGEVSNLWLQRSVCYFTHGSGD